jgi:eukaryotic-like serine/threonine-protein kinase
VSDPLPLPAEEAPRLVAGRYELGAVVGIGASAVVHRAWDTQAGRSVAVKLFRAGASAYDRRQQRQEMQVLARLDHPGLVALHDGGVADGRPFVVTDLVEGPTLAERILDGPLPPETVRDLGARLADALVHVHAGGIVHRDVKPANVLLGDGSRPRLADFGIARALDGTAATATGFVVGTAAYLAPEQVRGESVGPEADVYALGLVLLEALTGTREYPGLAAESATARLHRRPAVPPGLPRGLGAALRAMTATEPALRPTAAASAAALSGEGRAAVGPPTAAIPLPVRLTRSRPFATAGLVLAAVLSSVAVLGADSSAPLAGAGSRGGVTANATGAGESVAPAGAPLPLPSPVLVAEALVARTLAARPTAAGGAEGRSESASDRSSDDDRRPDVDRVSDERDDDRDTSQRGGGKDRDRDQRGKDRGKGRG